MGKTLLQPTQTSDRFLTADNFSSTGSIHETDIYEDGVIVLDHCESNSDHGPLAPTSSTGTYVSTPAHSGFGSYCKQFTGQQHIYSVHGIASGDFTVDFWARFPDVTGTRNLFTLRNSDVNGDAGLGIIFRASANKMYIYDNTGSESKSSDAGAASLSTNTWYHLALVYVASTHTVTIWLNGSKYLEYTTSKAFTDDFDSFCIGQAYVSKTAYVDEMRVRQGAKYTATFTPPTGMAVLGTLQKEMISMRYTYNLPYMSSSKIGGAKATTGLGVNITNAGYLYHTLKGGFGIHCESFDEEISSTMTPSTGINMEEMTTERVVEETTVNLWPLNGTLANSVENGDPFPATTYTYAQDNESTLIQGQPSADLLPDYPLTYATLEWDAKATDTEDFTYFATSETGYGIGFNGTTVKWGSMQSPEYMEEVSGTYAEPKSDFHHFAIVYTSYGIYFYYNLKQVGFQYLDDPWMNPSYDPYSENQTGLSGHISYGAPFYLHSVKISSEPKYDDETITLDKLVYVSADTTVLATKAEVTAKQADLTTVTGYDATKTQVLKHVNGVLQWVDETPAVQVEESGEESAEESAEESSAESGGPESGGLE